MAGKNGTGTTGTPPKVDGVKCDALETIKGLSRGDVAFEASQRLQELTKAVHETGKGGSMAIVVKLVPKTDLGAGAMMIEAEVTAKMPKPDKKSDIRFATDDGQRLLKKYKRRITMDKNKLIDFLEKQGYKKDLCYSNGCLVYNMPTIEDNTFWIYEDCFSCDYNGYSFGDLDYSQVKIIDNKLWFQL